jgi:hypothetical protein
VIAVVDASVIIKWLLQDPEREVGTDKATQLMELVTTGEQRGSDSDEVSTEAERHMLKGLAAISFKGITSALIS